MSEVNDIIRNLLDDSQIEDNDITANKFIRKSIDIATSQLELGETNAQILYLLGYAWYLLRIDSVERDHNIEKYLKLALEIRPTYIWASLYLGHFYFDICEYRKSLDLFSLINTNEFLEMDLVWRALKLLELRICCKLYLGEIDVNVDEFIESYLREDEIDQPNTYELKCCVKKIEKSLDKRTKCKLMSVIK